MLESVLYHYYARRRWQVQAVIDFTEPLRHPLGLQFANRLRVQRWVNRKLGRQV